MTRLTRSFRRARVGTRGPRRPRILIRAVVALMVVTGLATAVFQ